MPHTSSRSLRIAWLALLFSACSGGGGDGSACPGECPGDASTQDMTTEDAATEAPMDAGMDGAADPVEDANSGADTGPLNCPPGVDADELECTPGTNEGGLTDGGEADQDSAVASCVSTAGAVPPSHTLGSIQIIHDPAFGTAQDVSGATNGKLGAVLDDATSSVAALIAVAPTDRWDVTYDARAFQTAARSQLDPLITVLGGKTFLTMEGHPAVKFTYVYTAPEETSASAVRDLLVPAFTGGTAPGGASAGSGATTFFVDLTTVRRSDTLNDVIVVVSRADHYADGTKATAMRVDDLSNASGVVAANRVFGDDCQAEVTGSTPPMAELLFMIDTTKGEEDEQDRLGQAASKLFAHMSSAGVDARFGIFQASSGSIDFQPASAQEGWPNGFQFISGSDPNGPLLFARYVTETPYSQGGDNSPNLRPFRAVGNAEEPAAAAVMIHAEFKRRASQGETNPNFTLRPGAAKVAFFLTDEPAIDEDDVFAANDWQRSFRVAENPDTGTRFSPSASYSDKVVDAIAKYFQDNDLVAYGILPVHPDRSCKPTLYLSPLDLPRCMIELSGGAYMDIAQSTSQTMVDYAIERIATDVVGASSSIQLKSAAIASTLRVNVRGVDVPRSRVDGYDYVAQSRAIVFYGDTYRPVEGDAVLVNYRALKDGSP